MGSPSIIRGLNKQINTQHFIIFSKSKRSPDPMKKYIVPLLALSLLIFACTLESQFGLPNDEPVTTELYGTWIGVDEDDKLLIEPLNEKQYRLVIQDTIPLTAYSKTIKGVRVLDIFLPDEEQTTHVFYGFEVYTDSLRFWEVTEKLNEDDFESSKALFQFFKKNIKRPDFLLNGTVLHRVTE